jgi:hypothetical protein
MDLASDSTPSMDLASDSTPSMDLASDPASDQANGDHLSRLLWAANQSVIRSRLIDGGYAFSVDFNGDPLVQRFIVQVNNTKCKIWANPSVWGKFKDCYWGVFIEDEEGTTTGREYPDYDPQDTDACPADVEELFQGLLELKLR